MNKVFERLASYTMLQVIGIGLIFAGIYYFMGYDDGTSIRSQIATLQTQVTQEEAKKKETESVLKEEASMKDNVGQLSQQYQDITRRLPSTLYSIDINRSIDTLAHTAGVNVTSKKPGTVVHKEIVDEVPVEVNLEGTYAELAQFIYYVSTAERLTRVMNFKISQESDNGKGRLKFDGQVVGYKLGSAPAAGAKKE